MQPIRILLVDEHTIFRQGLISLYANTGKFMVVAEAVNGNDMIEKYNKHKPDIVISEIDIPGLSGLNAAKEILTKNYEAKIIFLTTQVNNENIYWALTNGIVGFISKSCDASELSYAIRNVYKGK